MDIHFHIEKRHLVVFLVAVSVLAVGFFVNAYNSNFDGGAPATLGHSADELMVKVPDSTTGSPVTLQNAIDNGTLGGGFWVADGTTGIKYDGTLNIDANGDGPSIISGVATPINSNDVATKGYVDAAGGGSIKILKASGADSSSIDCGSGYKIIRCASYIPSNSALAKL